jgi:predicted regulator of Ras-like GTPase activity (Roadblock/LC7/MglB family)
LSAEHASLTRREVGVKFADASVLKRVPIFLNFEVWYTVTDFAQENFMTKSRSELMVERLRNMQAAAPDIEASAVVSVDGLIMASALQQGVEEDRVSAMSAAMLSLGERISSELGRAGLEQVYIKGNAGSIVLTSIGEEAVLTAMARHEAKLGMVFLEMRRAAEDIVKLVG